MECKNLEKALAEWNVHKVRKPLILMGARQVGKTWLMEHYALCRGVHGVGSVWDFIYYPSKPRSKVFMAFAKNYLVRFSIPQLNARDRALLLSANAIDGRNALVEKSFGISREDVSAISGSLR